MLKIGAHNAATGEEGSFWSKLLTPFARCQSKTLVELYNAGVRLFDIRVRLYEDGKLYIHHGPWRTKHDVYDVLRPLLEMCEEPTFFEITYEDSEVSVEQLEKMRTLARYINLYRKAVVTRLNRKAPWEALEVFYPVAYEGDGVGFRGIRGWRCLLPVPWIWAKIHGKVKFNDKTFIYTDFV